MAQLPAVWVLSAIAGAALAGENPAWGYRRVHGELTRLGIDQRIPDSEHHPPRVTAGDFRIRQIRRKPVLSGLINEYVRAA